MARRSYAGGARRALLSGDVTASSTTFTFDDLTGWPTATFVFQVDAEKILATSRSGNAITVSLANRGYDATTAAIHTSGATGKHGATSIDFDEANALVNLADAKGDLVAASAVDTWARIAAGTNDHVLTADSTQTTGMKWAALTSASIAQPIALELKNHTLTKATNATATGAVSVSFVDGNEQQLTLTGNVTLTITNPPTTGKLGKLTLYVKQDATGSRLVTWPAAVLWPAGTAPTLTTTAAKTDVFVLVTFDGGTSYYGFVAGANF